ncbi:hypothetical protein HanRHA438_Chr05g0240461 [Helianthus annuus]|nr:hypothetical protein HanRHA438_Chr05g0240461 [Helianthus annuus]
MFMMYPRRNTHGSSQSQITIFNNKLNKHQTSRACPSTKNIASPLKCPPTRPIRVRID